MSNFSYKDYVTDETFLSGYNEYQAKYAKQIRESDKIVLSLIGDVLRARGNGQARLLDIGCSTGNLLLHIRKAFPELSLVGGDLALSSLEDARKNPELAGIDFREMSILDVPADEPFDIIIVNAVLYMMKDQQFGEALASINKALAGGGMLMVFDFFHPFPQDLTILEKSKTHPDGLELHFRPQSKAEAVLARAGFVEPVFRPFTLPIDLPMIEGDDTLITYTVEAADHRRLPFRGTLFQPWCHLTARKA